MRREHVPPEIPTERIRKALRCGRAECPCARPGPEGVTHCPSHDDERPSLSVAVKGGKVLVRCHAGCSQEGVVQNLHAQGLWRMGGLRDNRSGEVTTRNAIRDPDGNHVATHVRRDYPDGSKTFRWERPDGQSGLNGLHVKALPLYGVHEMGDAPEVVIVEGEKSREALKSVGVVAVGTVTGASVIPDDSALRPLVRPGRRIVLWPDADDSGRNHMKEIGAALVRLGAQDVRWIEPAADVEPGWDAADAMAKERDVCGMISAAIPFEPPADSAPKNGPRLFTAAEILDLENSAGPEWIVEGLLSCGGLSVLAGRPKAGKSTFARVLAVAVAQGRPFLGRAVRQGPVILMSLEGQVRDVARSLGQLGLRPEDPLFVATGGDLKQVIEWAKSHRPILVVIDTLGKLLKIRDFADYGPVLEALGGALALAREFGAHVLLLHHAPKGSDSRDPVDAPLGSVAISGTADTILHLKKRPDGTRTLAAIQRVGEELPESVVVLREDGWLELVGTKTEIQARQGAGMILDFLRTHGEATRQEILEGIQGEAAAKVRALDLLVREGRVVRTGTGKRGDPFRFTLASTDGDPPDPEGGPTTSDSVFPFSVYTANGKTEMKNRPNPASDLDESRSRVNGESSGASERNSPTLEELEL